MGDWCRHFTGIQHKTCKLGISYEAVRDSAASPYRWPCIESDGCPERCPSVSYKTPEEKAEEERAIQESIAKYFNDLNSGKCPHCGADIVEKMQVGRCVYAKPCWHRLYQGELKTE